jgi:hypothetical protein
LAAAFMIATSCADRTDERDRTAQSSGCITERVYRLSGEVINRDPILGLPADMALAGSSLWIRDAAANPSIHLLNPVTGRLLRSLGRRGQGPGELRKAYVMSATQQDSTAIWVWDIEAQHLVRMVGDGGADSAIRILKPDAVGAVVTHGVRLGSDRVVGLSVLSDSLRLHVFDGSGKRIRSLPTYLPGDTTVPIRERIEATLTATVCALPDGKRFAISYGGFRRVDLYDRDGNSIGFVGDAMSGADLFPFDRTTDKRAFRPTKRQWFLFCSLTERHVYALRYNDIESNVAGGNTVEVFDWRGGHVASLALDCNVSGLAVHPTEALLFATVHGTSEVVRFRLPPGIAEQF